MPGWRNWQTRRTQNPVAARPCRFDSYARHQFSKIPRIFELFYCCQLLPISPKKRHSLSYLSRFQTAKKPIKTQKSCCLLGIAARYVPKEGVEPTQSKAPADFESAASASSATPGLQEKYHSREKLVMRSPLRLSRLMVRHIRCQLPNNEFLKKIGGGSCANAD